MSLWRNEALRRLPELRRVIIDPMVDNPMMLWMQLRTEFDLLCKKDPLPLELIKRIWEYAMWCFAHRSGNVSTAAAYGFAEHLIDFRTKCRVLPKIMSHRDFTGMIPLLRYHHSEAEIEAALSLFKAPRPRRIGGRTGSS